MKKFLLTAVAIISIMTIQAQGIYQLWGTTAQGGTDDLGVIFSTDASGNSFQLRHTFTHKAPGSSPQHTQPVEYNGKLYGMTSSGGSNNCGVIFEWDQVTNLYDKKKDFSESDGRIPEGNLTLYNGKFYGMTSMGGDYGRGVIFEWDPVTSVYIKKIDFNGSNGAVPTGSLSIYNGKFYGMTSGGGVAGSGVIFEWDPASNICTKKVEFNSLNFGRLPLGSLTLHGNIFYGMTSEGGIGSMDANLGGTIFLWDPATNDYFKMFDFWGIYGDNPVGDLTVLDGKLYGMTKGGGDNGRGVIFEWDPVTNTYSKKYDFDGLNGGLPYGSLVLSEHKFYAVTSGGGNYNTGVIFEWDPATNIYSKKIDFVGFNGQYPYGSLTKKGMNFYGMTNAGGSSGSGVIFEWAPATNMYVKKLDFNGSGGLGSKPTGNLTQYNGKMYGMTFFGGDHDGGVIYEFDPVLNSYSKKFDFYGNIGNYPNSTLTLADGKFYGTVSINGLKSGGVIFEWNPVTNNLNPKFNFDHRNSTDVHGSLAPFRGKYYGMTSNGGKNNKGVIFEWDPASNICLIKIDFNDTIGSHPQGSLTLVGNKFYGLTSTAGNDLQSMSDGRGVIFEWDPVTNIYSVKKYFNNNGPGQPQGSLTPMNGKLYSTLELGGFGSGIIFEFDPATNGYVKKYDFTEINGSIPNGNLTLSGNKLYGMTNRGGAYAGGVIYEWDPATNIYTKKFDFNGTNGKFATPNNGLVLAKVVVSNGLPGSCVSYPPITINSTNNNQWVAVKDDKGNAVAEIKANGNNLGLVTASMFINAGPVRQDVNKKLYLDRSITITPQTQPTTPVDIRLYIKNSEYIALKNAVNTLSQPSGITSINDLAIYRVNSSCVSSAGPLTNPLITANAAWENDYVLAGSAVSLGSFYIAKSSCSAPSITEIYLSYDTLWPPFHAYRGVSVSYRTTGDCKCGTISNWLTVRSNEPESGTGIRDLSPDWVILDQHHVRLRAERDDHGNGRVYTITINSKNTAGFISTKEVKVIVPINMIAVTAKYLGAGNKMYLPADEVYDDAGFDCKVIPNPSSQYFNLQIESMTEEKIEVAIFDITGKQVSKLVTEKNKLLRFGDDLKPGVYVVKVNQGEQQKIIKVVKQ